MFIIQWFILQVKILKNHFKERGKYFLSINFLKGTIFVFGLSLLYFFLIYMFDFATKKQMPAFDFACILLSFCLLVFLPLIMYSTTVTALLFLFQKEEIAFYFSLPVTRTCVFMVKFCQIFIHATWMTFLGIFTFILALKNYFSLSCLIYLNAIFGCLLYLVIPVCLGVILTILISRFTPFMRAKDILTVVGLLVGSLILAFIRLMQPERLITYQGKIRLLTFIENLHKPWMTTLPSEWLTNIFFASHHKDIVGIYLNFFPLIIVAIVLLILTYLLAKVFYVHIWSKSISIPKPGVIKFGWQTLLKFLPFPLEALVKKDLLSFYRNTVERGSLLVFIPLAFIYFYSMHLINSHIRAYPEESIFSFLYLYLFNLFYGAIVICGLAGRWVNPSISQEGNNFKLIKISPISLRQFLWAKFWLGFLPLLVLGEILVVGSCFMLGLALPYTLLSFFIVFILTFGLTIIGIIQGARAANFLIKEPLEFALSYEGFLYLIWGLIYIVSIILLAGLSLLLFLKKGVSPSFILSLILDLVVMSLIFYGFYFSGKRAVFYLNKR